MLKEYYELTKPGIIFGNAITATAGFFLASRGHVNNFLFLAMLIGLSLVIACGAVLNNYIDRKIDIKMERTKNRALVRGIISTRNAITYGIILGFLGFFILGLYTNFLTTLITFVGVFFYLVVYSIGKRYSVHGALLGSVAGAVPPVVGYTAVTNSLDGGAFLLFLILVIWQMPHFYATAIYRKDDYGSAGIPVLPIKRGIHHTKIQMLVYVIAFAIATYMLAAFGYAGWLYAIVVSLVNFGWIALTLKGFWELNDKKWARKMFFYSLIVLMVWSTIIVVSKIFILT